jgi:hypothetical protein
VTGMHCPGCSSDLAECATCDGSGTASDFGMEVSPCHDCGGTGLTCPQHRRLWASLLPEVSQDPRNDEYYFDVEFGDPNPFIVPSAWLDQLSSINCRLGEQGTIHEESE